MSSLLDLIEVLAQIRNAVSIISCHAQRLACRPSRPARWHMPQPIYGCVAAQLLTFCKTSLKNRKNAPFFLFKDVVIRGFCYFKRITVPLLTVSKVETHKCAHFLVSRFSLKEMISREILVFQEYFWVKYAVYVRCLHKFPARNIPPSWLSRESPFWRPSEIFLKKHFLREIHKDILHTGIPVYHRMLHTLKLRAVCFFWKRWGFLLSWNFVRVLRLRSQNSRISEAFSKLFFKECFL